MLLCCPCSPTHYEPSNTTLPPPPYALLRGGGEREINLGVLRCFTGMKIARVLDDIFLLVFFKLLGKGGEGRIHHDQF